MRTGQWISNSVSAGLPPWRSKNTYSQACVDNGESSNQTVAVIVVGLALGFGGKVNGTGYQEGLRVSEANLKELRRDTKEYGPGKHTQPCAKQGSWSKLVRH